MANRKCKNCDKILTKRDNEDNWAFGQRKYCNKECYWAHKKTFDHSIQVAALIKSNIGHSRKVLKKTKDKIRSSVKKLWESPEYRNRQVEAHTGNTGEKAGNWRGGLSFEEYPETFNKKLRKKIRERDKYTCQECGRNENETKKRLDVHHIDYDKSNSDEKNLISLCKSCHSKTNYKRDDWKQYYKDKIKNI